ncbi:MAG: hypothetical protein Q4D26_02030 [Clostridia bacterium]|nr:hypothetical protein [Clostridia bacterium]
MNNFFNVYYNEICPTLQALDLIIKANYSNVDINELSNLLHITPTEINTILDSKHINNLTSDIIPTIMLNGSSYICKIFKKSLSYYNSKTYSPKDIAYIYNIDKSKVEKACSTLHITEISEANFPQLFKLI